MTLPKTGLAIGSFVFVTAWAATSFADIAPPGGSGGTGATAGAAGAGGTAGASTGGSTSTGGSGSSDQDDGGCSVSQVGARGGLALGFALLGLGLLGATRRGRSR